MRLSDYVREDLILFGLKARDASSALEAFASLFQERGHIPSNREAAQALKAREEAHTTCLGRGIAVPHATVAGLPKPLLLVATAEVPVAFGPPGSDPVDLFFVLLSPPGKEGEHIKLLARICRIAQHEEDLEEVRAAEDAESLHEAILSLDARHV
jgi:mannitol/fructose-specific phosphotransferase system IIA component (Ntr-type)